MIAWHLVDLRIVHPRRARSSEPMSLSAPMPQRWSPDWRALSAVLRCLRERLAFQAVAYEVPAAFGATDRELARLGPDPAQALADGVRNAQWLRADLAISRYR